MEEAHRTLGLRYRELALDQQAVPTEDFRVMRSVFEQFVSESGLPCCGVVRNFGLELVLQIGNEGPFSLPISSDPFRTRAQRFASALIEELARRRSTQL